MHPLVEARNLLDAAENETQLRTAASRAYFAAFRDLLEYAKKLGFSETKSGEDHKLLIAFFKANPRDLLRRIGHSRLPRLRKLRNHADYVHDVEFTKGMAVEVVEDAELIIFQWLGIRRDFSVGESLNQPPLPPTVGGTAASPDKPSESGGPGT